MGGLRSRLLLGSGASGLSVISRVAQQLIMVPILLSVWSAELYGEWLLISAVPIYISLSDFGFIAAGSNELARRQSFEDEASVKRFYDHYTVYFQRWSLLIALIFAILSYAPSWPSLLGLKLMSQNEAGTVFLILSLTALVTQNGLSLIAGLRVKARFHVGLSIIAVMSLLQIAAAFILVRFFGGGPTAVAATELFCALLSYLTLWNALRRQGLCQSTWPFQRFPGSNPEPMKRYLLLGFEMMLMPLAQALVLQGGVILVGKLLGAAAVTIFSTHRTLARSSSALLQLFSNPLRAEAGLMQRDEDRPSLTRIVVTLSRVTFWLALAVSAFLLTTGSWLFGVWTYGEVPFNRALFVPLLASVIAESIWRIASAVRLGTNRHRPIVWGYLILSIAGLAVAGPIALSLGPPGAAIGIALIDICMAGWVVWKLGATIDISPLSYAKGLFRPPIREIGQIGMRAVKGLKLW